VGLTSSGRPGGVPSTTSLRVSSIDLITLAGFAIPHARLVSDVCGRAFLPLDLPDTHKDWIVQCVGVDGIPVMCGGPYARCRDGCGERGYSIIKEVSSNVIEYA
jgi:hypothetical protein